MPPGKPRQFSFRRLVSVPISLLLILILGLTEPAVAQDDTAPPDTTAASQNTAPRSPEPTVDPALALEGDRPPSVNALYIDAAYLTLLRRPADSEGAAYWLDTIVSGGDRSREHLSTQLLFSTEGASNEVVRAYDDLLRRFPDQGGWTYWTRILQQEPVDALRILIMASEEYLLINGGQDNYVNTLYLQLLGRDAEPEGLAFWNGKLEGGEPRQNVVGAIYLSEEGLGNRVSDYYQEFLNRPATNSEKRDGIETILSGGERRLFAKVFASDEYYDQFFDQVFGG